MPMNQFVQYRQSMSARARYGYDNEECDPDDAYDSAYDSAYTKYYDD